MFVENVPNHNHDKSAETAESFSKLVGQPKNMFPLLCFVLLTFI